MAWERSLSAKAVAFASARSIRSGRVRNPRKARNASSAPGTDPFTRRACRSRSCTTASAVIARPIIKSLWTPSYVLVSSGLSLILLGTLHAASLTAGFVRWSPVLIWVGTNAILLYMLNRIVGYKLLAERLVGGDVSGFLDAAVTPGTGRLAQHATGLLIAILLARFLYRRSIFLKV